MKKTFSLIALTASLYGLAATAQPAPEYYTPPPPPPAGGYQAGMTPPPPPRPVVTPPPSNAPMYHTPVAPPPPPPHHMHHEKGEHCMRDHHDHDYHGYEHDGHPMPHREGWTKDRGGLKLSGPNDPRDADLHCSPGRARKGEC